MNKGCKNVVAFFCGWSSIKQFVATWQFVSVSAPPLADSRHGM